MEIMMGVTVIGEGCRRCPRLRIVSNVEKTNGVVMNVELECSSYEECLQAVDVYQQGLDYKEDETMKFGRMDDSWRKPIKCWTVFNKGEDLEMAECPECKYELDVAQYGTVVSLPLACPKCRAQLHGFKTAEGDG